MSAMAEGEDYASAGRASGSEKLAEMGNKSPRVRGKDKCVDTQLDCTRRRNLRVARMMPMQTLKNVLAMALPTIAPVVRPAATPPPAATTANKVLLMIAPAYSG
jgi:hypothetical protein